MITLILRGKLGQRFNHPITGNRWHLHVPTPAKALHHMNTIVGGFYAFIEEMESEMQGYHVQIDEVDASAQDLGLMCDDAVVTITPLLQGTDTKGVLQIVAGVALIAVGIAAQFYTGPAGTLVTGLGLQLVGLGLAVSLGGVARLLANSPESSVATQDKTKSSYIFTGAVNTIQQGECIPLTYGNPIQGSGVVAASIASEDVTN